MKKTEKYFGRRVPVLESVEELEMSLKESQKVIFRIFIVFAVIVSILIQVLIEMIYGWGGTNRAIIMIMVRFFILLLCIRTEINIVSPSIDNTVAIIFMRNVKENRQKFIIYPKWRLPAIAILDAKIDEFRFKSFWENKNHEMKDISASSSAKKRSIQFLLDRAGWQKEEMIREMNLKLDRAFIYLVILLVTVGMLYAGLFLVIMVSFIPVFIGLNRVSHYDGLNEKWSLEPDCEMGESSLEGEETVIYGKVRREYWDIMIFSKTRSTMILSFEENVKIENNSFSVRIMDEEQKISFD